MQTDDLMILAIQAHSDIVAKINDLMQRSDFAEATKNGLLTNEIGRTWYDLYNAQLYLERWLIILENDAATKIQVTWFERRLSELQNRYWH